MYSEKINKKRLDNLNYKTNGKNNMTLSQQKSIIDEIKKNYSLKDEIIDNILNV